MALQTNWASILNPIVDNPALKSIILKNISLIAGSNTINHKLGRKLQGYTLVRTRAASTIYDTQDDNQRPELTLLLTASAPVVVDILVF